MKILYIEDNEDNIFMLKTRLERKGYEVAIARDGKQGVDIAKSLHPDIIIMDIGLPIIDGYEATRLLKADPATHDIPIIVLTAHAMISDREKAFAAGADDYEIKPVNIEKLISKIEANRK